MQQPDTNAQSHDAAPQPFVEQSSSLSQAFAADMNSHLANAQRSVQAAAHTPDHGGSPVRNSDSQATMQGWTDPQDGSQTRQITHDSIHTVPTQFKAEASPVAERHQFRSYPCSPPSRSQMMPQSESRPHQLDLRSSDGRPIHSHRPSHSLGQAAAFMSGVHEREMFAHSHISAPASPSEGINGTPYGAVFQFPAPRHETSPHMAEQGHMFVHGVPHPHLVARASGHFSKSCAPSVRSTSPSISMASTSMTSISPLGSARINPDGSFTSQETSFDSLSNAASGSFSRASSTSDELFYSDLGSLGLASSLRMTKQKKKLRNIDRKMICDYSVANPTIKQDAIANEFGIERSTVSKILKQKEKWLAIDPQSESARIAKHRAVKFPEVEDHLTSWVAALKAQGEPIRDSTIRQEALRIAREIGLGEDKFKASGGWIEKFRERNSIPKPPSPESARKTPDASEAMGGAGVDASQKAATSSSPRPEGTMDAISGEAAANGSADIMVPSQSERRSPTRNTKAKGTPQKRGREAQQAVMGMSPLSQDMARMHFHAAGPNGPLPDPAFFRSTVYDGHPGMMQQMPGPPPFAFGPHGAGMAGPVQYMEDESEVDRKRRRAAQAQGANHPAMGLEAAINFQFPPNAMPASSSEPHTPAQFAQSLYHSSVSPQKGSPRGRRPAARPASGGEGSSRGRGRRGKARLSNANHAPQTPSPLSMSPADGRGEVTLQGMNAADAEQLTAATLERLGALQNAGDKSSIVTLEQAQQSVQLLRRFLEQQPRDFVPIDLSIAIGHLQANIAQKIREQTGASPLAPGSGSQLPQQAPQHAPQQAHLQASQQEQHHAATPSGDDAPANTVEQSQLEQA